VPRPPAAATTAAAVTITVSAALGACGDDVPAASELCLGDAAPIETALRGVAGGGAVALPDATTLAQCVERATSDAQLQSLGLTFTTAADHLAERAERPDADAARQLGFLVGATRRGAARTNGTHLELARRIGLVAGRLEGLPANVAAALRAGVTEGERRG